MKIDLAKMPVLEGIIAFLIVMLGVTFVGAFAATDGGGGEAAGGDSPTPAENGAADGTPGTGETPAPGGAIQVVMEDNSFNPDEITVQAGSMALFEITNEGGALHNMHIAGEGGDYTEDFCTGEGDPCSAPNRIAGGESGTLTWQVPASPGEVDFRCDFHPSEMTGTITIE